MTKWIKERAYSIIAVIILVFLLIVVMSIGSRVGAEWIMTDCSEVRGGVEWDVPCPGEIGDVIIKPKPCPWSHKSVPADEVIKWLDEGWEFVTEYLIIRYVRPELKSGMIYYGDYPETKAMNESKILIRKRICSEGKDALKGG